MANLEQQTKEFLRRYLGYKESVIGLDTPNLADILTFAKAKKWLVDPVEGRLQVSEKGLKEISVASKASCCVDA